MRIVESIRKRARPVAIHGRADRLIDFGYLPTLDSLASDVTFFPGGTKFGCSLDLGIMKAYADAGATRLLITPSGEAQSTDLKVLERFIKRCQDEVIAKL